MSGNFAIAIDGPSGAGKSTIAKLIAQKLNINYIDTGAMYRAVGYKMAKENIPAVEGAELQEMLDNTSIDFVDGDIILDGEIVNDVIRTPEVAAEASKCATLGIVRKKLVELQQEMAKKKSVIMDGRDIGTVVLKDAKNKFYLTATVEERARRRYAELVEKGESVSYDDIVGSIQRRDYEDMNREINPLRKADDADEIDSSNMTIDQVVDYICSRVSTK